MDDLLLQIKVVLWKVMHFRWSAIAIMSTILLIGWTVVSILPDKYQVKSTVYVDTQSMLRPLLKGLAVDDTVKEQAAIMMRRTLLSRPNIEKVILQTDLDLTVTNDKQMERLVTSLVNGITISGHADKRRPDTNLYRIAYSHESPETAYKVVDALLDVFLESTLGIARQGSSSASKFMSRQISDYKGRLESSDEAVKQFNIKYAGLLPDETSTFYNRVALANTQLDEARLGRRELEFKAQQLQEQLKGVNKEISAATAAQTDRSLSTRISALELQLAELRVHFTDDHPDVASILASIKGLNTQAEENASTKTNSEGVMIENPVYQETSILLGQTRAELAVLTARVEEYQARVDQLQSKVEIIPQIEAEYTALIRDYNIISKTYQELVQRKESALISEDAERSGDTVQFRVIEPPKIPLTPIGPNRPIFLTAVLAIGAMAGIGLAMLMAEIKGAIYSKNKLVDIFSAPVLGEVSMTWNSDQLLSKKRDIFGLAAALLLITAIFLILIYYQINIVGLPLG
ncbi:MAG: hypothetical protein KUG52_00725 [Immundisolibacteraceae bacterium]|nr:hypothetical protein [Immundisolibacteraceae bacterium]